MKRYSIWGLVGLAAFLSGCTVVSGPKQSSPITETYALEYELGASGDTASLPAILRVESFNARPFFNTDKIVYRERAFQRSTYLYHKWQARPGELVTERLIRDLRRSGGLSAVLPPDSTLPPTHVLEGTVEEFLEQDSDHGWEAVLALNITLSTGHDSENGIKILLQKTYAATEPCAAKNPRSLAEAMSRAMATVSRQIITDIRQAVTRQ